MRVLVSHPGRQHAHQLAWALEAAGHLAAFWSGVPVVDSRYHKVGYWGIFAPHLRAIPVPAVKRKHPVVFPLLRKLCSSRMFGGMGNELNHRLDRAYDFWVARGVRKLRPDMVVCYENSALNTFKAAHEVGAICVLDAASVHYLAARKWLKEVGQFNPAWIDVRKQEEIDLADAILTCSELAAGTYQDAGVPSTKLFPVPLGTHMPETALHDKAPGARCRFVFAGSLRSLKGVDVLLEIFEELEQEGIAVELVLIGGVAEKDLAKHAGRLPNVTHRPYMPQSELFAEMAHHDCLILPSRFDSFGMVVAEGMAVGLPAIVSDRVGAKCIIEQHPDSGWIVPCDKAALKVAILQVVRYPESLVTASRAARAAARDYSWESYRCRVAQTLEGIYARYVESAR